MQSRYKLRNREKLHEILYAYDHNSNQGSVDLYIRQGNHRVKKEEISSLQNLLKDKIPSEIILFESDPYKRIKSYFIRLNPRDFRVAVDHLHQLNYISEKDRVNLIKDHVKKMEDAYSLHAKITSEITPAQKDIIESIYTIYIDSLLEAASNEDEALTLLQLAFSSFGKDSYPDVNWFTFLGHTTNYSAAKKREVADCLTPLSKAFHGNASLESTFLKQGVGIPSLALQRDVILNYTHQKFTEKFPLQDETRQSNLSLIFNAWRHHHRFSMDLYYKPLRLSEPLPNEMAMATASTSGFFASPKKAETQATQEPTPSETSGKGV